MFRANAEIGQFSADWHDSVVELTTGRERIDDSALEIDTAED
jgi:hypothetical protein